MSKRKGYHHPVARNVQRICLSLTITLALGSNLALGQDLAAVRTVPDQQAPRLEQGSKAAQILPTGQRIDLWAIPGGQFWDAIAQRSCGKIATVAQPRHDAQYWAEKTKGMDFHVEDHIDTQKYNRILWEGIMGTPYPEHLRLDTAGAIDTPDHD